MDMFSKLSDYDDIKNILEVICEIFYFVIKIKNN